jgi:hypothetical protein
MRFETCTTYCHENRNGTDLHTTKCELDRGLLKPKDSPMKKRQLVKMLRPFIMQATGRARARGENLTHEEIWLRAVDKFYQLAIDAQFITPASEAVKKEVELARAHFTRSAGEKSA